MPRRPATVTQANIARTLRAVTAADWVDAKVEIRPDGTIIVQTRDSAASPTKVKLETGREIVL